MSSVQVGSVAVVSLSSRFQVIERGKVTLYIYDPKVAIKCEMPVGMQALGS